MKLERKGKAILVILFLVVAFFGIKWYQNKPKDVGDLVSIGKVSIPDAPEASLKGSAAVKVPFPSTKKTSKGDLIQAEWWMMAWQSQNSAIFANGGAETTEGSLMEQAGWDVKIVRQDNCTQSCTQMIKYIQDYKDGKTKDGYLITFMGSGIPNYFTGIYNAVKDLGPEYAPICFITFGKSYGEDQVIGAKEIKDNKQLLKGKVLRGVRMDGDIDIALKLCGDNNIRVNQDPNLYYPDALNLSYGDDFLKVVNDYNNNLKETRKLVVNGKTAGDTTVGIDLVATWTPGDVNAMNGRGGVTIISTKEYASIMPNITISCKKFLNDNRDKVDALIAALAQAGDQIRSFDDVKKYTCGLGASVWGENDANYWYKYYNGVQINKDTHLGGSMVFNLKDMAYIMGLDGSRDTYKDIYNTFGTLQSKYYPKDLPTYVDYTKVFDKSFIRSVMDNHPELMEGQALKTDYTAASDDDEVIGNKSWSIQFETGSATIKPESYTALDNIAQEVSTSDGLKVTIEGHTDNSGSDDINIPLSEARAQSVVQYLVSKKLDSDRFTTKGFGSTKPIADNSTAAGKAKNRRVQIILTK